MMEMMSGVLGVRNRKGVYGYRNGDDLGLR